MKEIILIGLMLTLIVGSFFLGYWRGKEDKQTEIEYRAQKIEKQTYNNQDIELIIFGTTQQ